MERLSYLTVAVAEDEDAKVLQEILPSCYIKVNTSRDILGNEYSAILKTSMLSELVLLADWAMETILLRFMFRMQFVKWRCISASR